MTQECVIWSGEWQAYWRSGCCGYMPDVRDAGVYSLSAAEKATAHCGPEKRIEMRPIRLRQVSVPELIDRGSLPDRARSIEHAPV